MTALLALSAGAENFAPAPAEGLPAAGTTWNYGFRDDRYRTAQRRFSVQATAIEGNVVVELFIVDGGDIFKARTDAREQNFVPRTFDRDVVVVEFAPYSFDPPATRRSPLPMKYPDPSSIPWKISAPSYAQEQVTVPAGTFKAVRVRVSGTAPAFGQGNQTAHWPTRFVYTTWYAPEVKRYVKARHQTWSRWGADLSDEVIQLLGYEPAQGAAAKTVK